MRLKHLDNVFSCLYTSITTYQEIALLYVGKAILYFYLYFHDILNFNYHLVLKSYLTCIVIFHAVINKNLKSINFFQGVKTLSTSPLGGTLGHGSRV